MRTFEAMGAGALVLMFRIKDNGFNSIFTENKNLVVFDDIVGGLKTKIDYYLKNTEERMRIAKEGFNLIRNNHTYRHRLLEMFKIMGFKLEG
jgi:spore maturation protein CgeB